VIFFFSAAFSSPNLRPPPTPGHEMHIFFLVFVRCFFRPFRVLHPHFLSLAAFFSIYTSAFSILFYHVSTSLSCFFPPLTFYVDGTIGPLPFFARPLRFFFNALPFQSFRHSTTFLLNLISPFLFPQFSFRPPLGLLCSFLSLVNPGFAI